jgi:phosphohistidine phosphatase
MLHVVRVYLVRHAKAEDGEPDTERRLSVEGRKQARDLAERLRREGVRPDAVLTSPLVRARQTAEEIARAVGIEAEADGRLAPGATADDLRAAVAGRGATVIAVGHQPDCGRIAAELTGGPEPPFPAAGVVPVDLG